MSVRVAARYSVPIASAGTSVPWLARLPFLVRTIIRRWRGLRRSRTLAARIQPQDNCGQLKAGMSARASIITASKDNVLVAVRAAVMMVGAGNQPTVVSLQDSNAQEFQTTDRLSPVKIGLMGGQFVEIAVGLDERQHIASSGLGDLHDADLVVPRVADLTAMAR